MESTGPGTSGGAPEGTTPPPPPPPSNTWSTPPPAPSAGPAGYYYADVPNRAIAYIIDVIIIGIINIIILAVLGGIFGGGGIVDPVTGQLNFIATVVIAVVGLVISGAYFVYTWTSMRATIGMRLLGMQIGNETDGSTLTQNQAITRWILLGAPFSLAQLLNPIPALGLIISLAGLVWLIALLVTTAQSPTKQGLHDRYAHTVVVKAGRAAA
ncbi:MAG TPA: RDD family protein [Candidatus Limnocylindrales bacterium]|jgi:uncharacterized RDD family membrane protein YckC|nr:RDD family protein [Candidatus Limnocylindrales bacterium]